MHRLAEDGTGRRTMIIADDVEALENPDFSALLHIHSKRSGLAFPVVTTDEMQAIENPRIGLMVYNSDEEATYIYTKKKGWFSINGLKLPDISKPNSVMVWGGDDGSVVRDSGITIGQDNIMLFPEKSVIDLPNGTIDAETIACEILEVQAYLTSRKIEVNELNSNTINGNNISCNNINSNNSNFNTVNSNNIRADNITSAFSMRSSLLNLAPMSETERSRIRNPKIGDLVCLTRNGGVLSIFLGGEWQTVVTTN